MASIVDGPGQSKGRPLVLRPITPAGQAGAAQRLVSGTGSRANDHVWELADPWGSHDGPSAAFAVTRRVGDMVMLLEVTVDDGSPPETIRCLVQQLVAILRRTDASVVCSSVDADAVRDELLAAGFVALPDGRPRLILQL